MSYGRLHIFPAVAGKRPLRSLSICRTTKTKTWPQRGWPYIHSLNAGVLRPIMEKTMNRNVLVGGVAIVVGTSIGAGILGLPMVAANSGFVRSFILLIGACIVMLVAALLVLEVNLSCPDESNSFSSMAYRTWGRSGQVLTWIIYLCFLYSLIALYAAGGGSLLKDLLHSFCNVDVQSFICITMFIGVLGVPVFISTKAVDYANRTLVFVKSSLLIVAIFLLLFYVDRSIVFPRQEIYNNKLASAVPIFLAAFCFQMVVPSLRNYVGDKRNELRLVLVWGSAIPFIIYSLWLLGTLGVVPTYGPDSFSTIRELGNSPCDLVNIISKVVNSTWTMVAIKGFASISMTTSFLGVSLALFDFLSDGFSRPNTTFGRLQTICLTFIPPLIFALCYPDGYMLALQYASCFVAILTILLPALMAYKLSRQKDRPINDFINTIILNKYVLIGIMAVGTIAIVLSLLDIMNCI